MNARSILSPSSITPGRSSCVENNQSRSNFPQALVRGGGGGTQEEPQSSEPQHTPTTSTTTPLHATATALARAEQVKTILSRRLDHVKTGKRGVDFQEWLRQQKKSRSSNNNNPDGFIVSTHGIAAPSLPTTTPSSDNNESTSQQSFSSSSSSSLETTLSKKMKRQRSANKDDPFPSNRLDLDIDKQIVRMDDDDNSASTAANHLSNSTPSLLPELQPSEQSASSRSSNSWNQYAVEAPASWWQLCRRAVTLTWHFGPAWSTVGLAYCIPAFRRRYWYSWVAQCIAQSGAAFIKWGQWTSTRNDMFPEAFCAVLAQLHNDAPAHDWNFSRQSLEESLGLAPHTLSLVFDDFDPQPLASGSIAQVHRAVLNQQYVAVKIRHPRVAHLLEMDFQLMATAATVLEQCIPAIRWLRLRESIAQFSSTMAAQAHLQVEAHHLERLNHNFQAWPAVNFPHPIYASSSVIIETFESGRIVTQVLDEYHQAAQQWNNQHSEEIIMRQYDKDENDEDDEDEVEYTVQEPDDHPSSKEDENYSSVVPLAGTPVRAHELVPLELAQFIVTTGVGLYLKMLLVDNLMHADLHPGNIMLDLYCHREKEQESKTTSKTALAVLEDHEQQQSKRSFFSWPFGNRNNKKTNYMAVTLVDAGMVAQLSDHEGSVFIGLLSCLGSGNGREAAHFALLFSDENEKRISAQAKQGFADDMQDLFRQMCRGYGTNVDVGEVLRGVLGLIRKYHIRIDANYATLVVNILCIESLGRQTFPSYNVLDAARPLLESYRSLCYTKTGVPKPNARRSKWVQIWLSLMYWKKGLSDRQFFRTEANRRRRRQQQRKRLRSLRRRPQSSHLSQG